LYKANLCDGPEVRTMRHTKITLAYLLSFLSFTSEAVPNYRFHICSEKTTFMPNTTYQYNLNSLLSSLSSNAMTQSGFYNTSTGKKPGSSVYGLFLCRGDLTTHACQDCVVTATKVIVDQYYCPIEKEAVIWYDECMLRYSNRSIFSVMEDQPRKYFWSVIDIAVAPDHFLHLAETTLNDLVHLAVNSSGAKKFATKEAKFTEYQTLYSLVQCTPDLSSFHCNKCLGEAITNLPMCCNGKQGGRVLYPSCNIRYEIYPFYQIQAVDAPVPAPAPALTHILLPPPPDPGSTTRPKGKSKTY
jgi:hypothetical protein